MLAKICRKIFNFWENFEFFFIWPKNDTLAQFWPKIAKIMSKAGENLKFLLKFSPKNGENFEILAKFGH